MIEGKVTLLLRRTSILYMLGPLIEPRLLCFLPYMASAEYGKGE